MQSVQRKPIVIIIFHLEVQTNLDRKRVYNCTETINIATLHMSSHLDVLTRQQLHEQKRKREQ
jgi:hypothetical protein